MKTFFLLAIFAIVLVGYAYANTCVEMNEVCSSSKSGEQGNCCGNMKCYHDSQWSMVDHKPHCLDPEWSYFG